MNSHMRSIGVAADRMLDSFLARLPALVLGILVFLVFYGGSVLVSRLIRRATHIHRHNVGIVFARLVGTSIVLLGFLVSFSIVAPSFQAGDLIKFLGIGSVAIGFAFQNILQNFLAGLLLLWTEPFRVGDQIKLDEFEGTVEDIETRATKIKTYDGRRVVIPNADLFTHSVTIHTAYDSRRGECAIAIRSSWKDLGRVKSLVVNAVRETEGVLPQPPPEVMIEDMDGNGNLIKLRASWWTTPPRHHQVAAMHDRILAVVSKVLAEHGFDPASVVPEPRAA